MSHFSKIQTKISNREFLVDALKALGYNPKVGNHNCRGYQGQTLPVEILMELTGTEYNLGFAKNNGYYELVADWYGIKNFNSDNLLNNLQAEIAKIENKIKQQYAYQTITEKLAEQGFSIDNEARENGEIRIKLTRMA